MSSKRVGLEVLEELLHPARLELEYSGRLAGREELIGARVVAAGHPRERSAGLRRRAFGPCVDQADRDVDDRQRLQAEEVELDEARLLDVVLVVLRDKRSSFCPEDTERGPTSGPSLMTMPAACMPAWRVSPSSF